MRRHFLRRCHIDILKGLFISLQRCHVLYHLFVLYTHTCDFSFYLCYMYVGFYECFVRNDEIKLWNQLGHPWQNVCHVKWRITPSILDDDYARISVAQFFFSIIECVIGLVPDTKPWKLSSIYTTAYQLQQYFDYVTTWYNYKLYKLNILIPNIWSIFMSDFGGVIF